MNVFFLIVMSAFSARQDSKPDEILRIEFSSLTRGYHEELVLTKDSITRSYTGTDRQVNQTRRANTKAAWKDLQHTVDHVDWATFDQLPSPSNKRAFDGARHSTITITTRNHGTHNHTFDDEKPNAALDELMQCIVRLRSKN